MKKEYLQKIIIILSCVPVLLVILDVVLLGKKSVIKQWVTIEGGFILILYLVLSYILLCYCLTWRAFQIVTMDEKGVKIKWLCFEKKWEWKDARIIRWQNGQNQVIFISFTKLIHIYDVRFALHDVMLTVIDDKIRALPDSNNLAYFTRRDSRLYGEFEKNDVLTLFARWGLTIKRALI